MEVLTYQPNVELEELRNTPEDHPDLTCQLREWLACSEQVSLKTITSYMAGWEVIQTISQFIDGTPVGSNGDWKEFASVLGFDILFIQKVENFSNTKGVCLDILTELAVQKNGTLAQVLRALHDIQRLDILNRISSKTNELFQNMNAGGNVTSEDLDFDSGIVGSDTIRVVGEADSGNLESAVRRDSSACQKERAAAEKVHSRDQPSKKKKNKSKVVLLTFADDGHELAMAAAEAFRNATPSVGVLILERNKEQLQTSSTAIHRWFNEVDYIVPIITDEYLWQIAPRAEPFAVSPTSSLDARLARLVYVMMNEEYVRNGCRNYRVRPVRAAKAGAGPDRPHLLLSNPLFYVCRGEDQLDDLARTLANSRPVQRFV